MKKILLTIIIIFLIFIWFSYWDNNNYLEYADIPWTDTITMNWNIDGNIYEVFVNTGNIDYITWSDWGLHNCFTLQWTWYTKKIWEIYFNYDWYNSYVCDDNKLRWVFKIWAGWRWHMEDLGNNPEKWKLFLDKTTDNNWNYYHNKDNNWSGTGQARLDNIWYSNWDTVRTMFNNQQAWSKISITSIINWANIIANWTDNWNIKICISYSGNKLINYSVDSIHFISGYNSDIILNWKYIPWFSYSWNLKTNNNGCITWYVTSLHGWNWLKYWIQIKKWNNIFKTEWITSFKYPFSIIANLTWNEIPWKILMWYKNSISFSWEKDNHIDNLEFKNIKSKINLWTNDSYFNIITWTNINIDWNNYDIQINRNNNFFSWDFINVSYDISWSYIIWKNWKKYTIQNFELNNINPWKIYKEGKIKNILIVKETDSTTADGKNILWYKASFLNKKGNLINNLTFSWSIIDTNKYFNLNKKNDFYRTWVFLKIDNSSANTNWIYKIWLVSYKPVSNVNLSWIISNINYNWYYNVSSNNQNIQFENINFTNISNFSFEQKTFTVNQDNNIKVNYNWSSISNPAFSTTWTYINGSGCSFVKWKVITWDLLWESTNTIRVDCTIEEPSAIIYTWYYNYDLTWDFWIKTVYNFYKKEYSPILFVGGSQIKVLWNVVSNKKIIGWIKYISTSINSNKFKNKIKQYVYKNYIIWWNFNTSPTEIDLSTLTWNKIYKCDSNEIITLIWNNTDKISLYFIWCWINIQSNIQWNWKLNIFGFWKRWKEWFNLSDIDWWKKWWNIYIKSNVKTIEANIITDGSILTYTSWSNITSDSIFTWRINNDNLKSQLLIKWKIYSKNTIWWWNKDLNNQYMFVWWKKVTATDNIFWKSSTLVSKSYDITFLKNNFVHTNWTYDTWNLSEYIYKKYHCTWNKSTDTDKFCYSTIVIEDWN